MKKPRRKAKPEPRPLVAVDLCCGAGGWAVAARGLPIRFAAVADMAADCLETWAINHRAAHPGCRLIECDLSTPDGADAVLSALQVDRVKVDLVLGGIPCEQVSTARGNKPLKEGEQERLHALIDHVWRLIQEIRPRYWCIEDVEAIVPHLPTPIGGGLNFEVRKIDASEYGPQARERVFFGVYPWPIAAPKPGPRTLGEVLRPGPYRTLSNLAKYERSRSKWYAGKVRVQEPDEPGATVISASNGRSNERGITGTVMPRDNYASGRVGGPAAAGPTVMDPSDQGRGGRAHIGVPLVGAQARNLDAQEPSPTVTESYRCDERTVPLARVQDAGQPCPTVAAFNGRDGHAQPVDQDGLVRVLEWQEAALLQGFDPSYVFAASWSRTWKLVAQAIPIQVGVAVLEAIANDARA